MSLCCLVETSTRANSPEEDTKGRFPRGDTYGIFYLGGIGFFLPCPYCRLMIYRPVSEVHRKQDRWLKYWFLWEAFRRRGSEPVLEQLLSSSLCVLKESLAGAKSSLWIVTKIITWMLYSVFLQLIFLWIRFHSRQAFAKRLINLKVWVCLALGRIRFSGTLGNSENVIVVSIWLVEICPCELIILGRFSRQ